MPATPPVRILVDDASHAIAIHHHADALGLALEVDAREAPLAAAARELAQGHRTALVISRAFASSDHAALADAARAAQVAKLPLVIATPGLNGTGAGRVRRDLRALASDLGAVVVGDLASLVSALLLPPGPFRLDLRGLDPAARRVLRDRALPTGPEGAPTLTLTLGDEGSLRGTFRDEPRTLGPLPVVARALQARAGVSTATPPEMPYVEGVDHRQVREILFGPRRALSDPTSKSALLPYDLPLPEEELCASPSRAASEATRMGFPVRVSVASPRLRAWAHPDLVAPDISSAARVRDVFRQITSLARARADAPVLGVMVAAATRARALLSIEVRPLGDALVQARLGFADPHGLAADDHTLVALPLVGPELERALDRLRGSSLLFGEQAPIDEDEKRLTLAALQDTLLRLAAFVHEWRAEVESVEVRPLAILPGGAVEVREACVQVSAHYERELDLAAG